jgi:DNA-directed RNA polymerase specialized sigma24 family protein
MKNEELSLRVQEILLGIDPMERAPFSLHVGLVDGRAYSFRKIAKVMEISEEDARDAFVRVRDQILVELDKGGSFSMEDFEDMFSGERLERE